MTNSDFNFRTPKTANKVSLTAELARIDRIARSSFSPIPVTLGQATPELTEKSDPTILLEGMHINLDNLTEEEIKEFLDAAIKVKKMIEAAIVNGSFAALLGAIYGAGHGYLMPQDSSLLSCLNGIWILGDLKNMFFGTVTGILEALPYGIVSGLGGAAGGVVSAYPDKRQKYEAAINALKQISIELDRLGKYTSQPVISNLPAAGHIAGQSCGLLMQKIKELNSRLKATINKKS